MSPLSQPDTGLMAELRMAGAVFVLLVAATSGLALLWQAMAGAEVAAAPETAAMRRYVPLQSSADQDDPRLTQLAREKLGRDLTPQERKAVTYCWRTQPARGVTRGSPYYAAILDADGDGIACEPDQR